ncbi:MAG TPA: ABC transporter substrate-binding protein [Verrucomicrobiae bacterium]|jgi:ABC-type transporter MlaC component|nr:ABC transporter substrate-binding protein [Verrucomicrobiae bacterium]
MRFSFFGIVVLAAFFSAARPVSAQAPGAQQIVEDFLTSIRSMEFPPKDEAAQKPIVDKANSLLDLEAMSKKALDAHWDSLTPEQRQSFLGLMGQLIEHVAYPKSRRFMGNYQITYPSVTPDETGTRVQSIIKQEEQGLDAEVIYHISQAGKIDDVFLDGVSITEDLKYQFDKIISEKQFDGLIETMQKRLADAKNPQTPAA